MVLRKSNFIVSNATRISVGLLLIVLSALGCGYSVGLLPSHDTESLQHHLESARSLAVQFSAAIEARDVSNVQDLAGSIQGSLPEIASIGLRRDDGRLVFATADHEKDWANAAAASLTSGQFQPVKVSIFDHANEWGRLELTFHVAAQSVWKGLGGLLLFVTSTCLLGFIFFMKRTLKVLDPSQVIPERVKAMLDTLAEGAAIIDSDGRIVLANQSLARILDTPPAKLLGVDLAHLPWKIATDQHDGQDAAAQATNTKLPWDDLSGAVHCRGQMVKLETSSGERQLMVNASSILGGQGSVRGCVFTFDDVTGIEKKNQQLVEMVQKLGQAQERVQKQNEELQRLATRDVLTGCLNRRAFHEQFSTLFSLSKRTREPLGAILVDIDHFKAVNDNHGHAKGDEVLRAVAEILRGSVRGADVVCRYGGEEFCILAPTTNIEGAHCLGESLRRAIAEKKIADLGVTISVGVSSTVLGAESMQLLLEQADEALYNSKRAGRNRATRFDRLDTSVPRQSEKPTPQDRDPHDYIPVDAVRSLVAALSFRDPQTAQHSRRVSELCVKVGASWLDSRELFILETAALLHDIGKVGVPDAVLLKAGPLNDAEWKLMREHDRIGVEIINTAFNCAQLTAIVANHHAHHDWTADSTKLQSQDFVPLCARLLAIADAYDAMTTHRCYRPATTHDAAVVELRRCAGSQFDPRLVELFVTTISNTTAAETDTQAGAANLANALRLSMEAETLANKLAEKDLESTVAIAKHLAQMAAALGSHDIAEQCEKITSSVESAADAQTMVSEACNLLDMVNPRK